MRYLFVIRVDDGSNARNVVPDETKLWCQLKPEIRSGKPSREILAYTDEHNIDLICMGVCGAGFGRQSLFGSNVDRVLRQASCPVLIARPPNPASFVLAESKISLSAEER